MAEFDIIREYFQTKTHQRDDVVLAIGDDAAVVDVPADKQLVIAVDTMIAGTHFFHDCPADAVGHKALAVNLSDLAAMAATPVYFTLALSLSENNASWLTQFSEGLFHCADAFGLQLIGGDTTQGPLSMTIQAMGLVDKHQFIRRSGAEVGDAIFVTGQLGRAGLALQHFRAKQSLLQVADQSQIIPYMHKPTARVREALVVKPYLNAAIDISDGLVADLSHLLEQSGVGAEINVAQLPIAELLFKYCTRSQALDLALYHGDDYELIWVVKQALSDQFKRAVSELTIPVTQIGTTTQSLGLKAIDDKGKRIILTKKGFEHFSGSMKH